MLKWEQGGLEREAGYLAGWGLECHCSELMHAGRAGRQGRQQAGRPFFFIRLVAFLDRISNSWMKNEVKCLSCLEST